MSWKKIAVALAVIVLASYIIYFLTLSYYLKPRLDYLHSSFRVSLYRINETHFTVNIQLKIFNVGSGVARNTRLYLRSPNATLFSKYIGDIYPSGSVFVNETFTTRRGEEVLYSALEVTCNGGTLIIFLNGTSFWRG